MIKRSGWISLAAKAFSLTLFCALVGLVLIVAANLLPLTTIKQNVLGSISQLNYAEHQVFPKRKLDHWTECDFTTLGMRSPEAEQQRQPGLKEAFLVAIESPMLGNCEQIASGDKILKEKFWYWHGYQIISKPILSVVTVPTLRLVVLVGFCASFVLFLMVLGKRFSWFSAGAVAVLVILSPLYSQLLLLPHASAWIIAFCAASLVLCKQSVSLEQNILKLLVIGFLVAYFDFLINPIVAPTAAIAAITIRRWLDGHETNFLDPIWLFGSWFAGYVGFWSIKWAIAAVVLGGEAVTNRVAGKISQRLNADVGWSEVSAWVSVSKNVTYMALPVLITVIVLGLSVVMIPGALRQIRYIGASGASFRPAIQMLSVGTAPVVWLLVVQNHSIVHTFIVAPILTWTLICIVFAVHLVLLPQPVTTQKRSSSSDTVRDTNLYD